MGIGIMVSSREWAFAMQPHLPRQLQQRNPSSLRGIEASFESARSTQHLILEGGEILNKDALQPYAYSYGALQSIDNLYADGENTKINIGMKSLRSFRNWSRPINMMEDTSAYLGSLNSINHSKFSLLMENLDKIEDVLSCTDWVRMERDVLVHIKRLGALKLFHACLSRTLMSSSAVNPNFLLTKYCTDCPLDFAVGGQKANKVVRSGKKEERKLKRVRASDKSAKMSSLSAFPQRLHKVEESKVLGRPMGSSKPRTRRSFIARNELEMAKGVKEVANLERTYLKLEEEIGRAASYSQWAEAAGIDDQTLKQRLQFGWYCRDKLIKSTQSLVVYLARNYRGMGIAFDDLLQAGNIGVLKGAERFDGTRGYRFSTYVQYWIRKSILALVARHSKGIRIPVRMEKAIRRIQKATRNFCITERRYPHDDEMAELTGLSLANVGLARKCSRVVGSLDQEMGEGWCTKFMEVTPDTSIKSPDEIIMRQHMKNDIFVLLQGLDPRERQVLMLRYGLEDGRSRSLGEIGNLSSVTKEWIRKIEKAALAKIRRDDIQRELKYYLNWQSVKRLT